MEDAKTMTFSRKMGWTFAAGIMMAGVYACAQQMPEAGAPEPRTLAQLEAKVSGDAVLLMERADHQTTYGRLGQVQFDRANELMRWAAIAAGESDACSRVETVAVSDQATREQIRWFADCANGERFMISQEQALAALGRYDPEASDEAKALAEATQVAEPASARWKNFDEATAVSACDLTVQNAMLVPGSFSTGVNRWAIDKNDETGIVIIERDYETDNAYGMTLNSRYRCEVNTDSGDLVGLSIREPNGWQKLI